MARTELFRALRRAVAEARFLDEKPELASALVEHREARRDRSEYGRRAFLETSLKLGLSLVPLAALEGCGSQQRHASAPPPSADDPVCILGGGVAGLTVAYRLTKAGVPCVVYEGSRRLGGRIWTRDKFNAEGMFCEMGGELIDTTHVEIIFLAHELGLGVDDFRPGDRGLRRHQYFFGKQRYFDEELTGAATPLARHLARDMAGIFDDKSKGAITYRQHRPEAARLDRLSLAEYLYGKKDVARWVLDAVNVAYLGEFGLDTEEQSALNLLVLINPDPRNGFGIFGDSDEALRIQGGNGRLPEALGVAVRERAPIHLDHTLVKIADDAGGLSLTFRCEDKTKVVRAGRVVCTLPFTVLRHVDGIAKLGLSPRKRRSIERLGYGTNAKRMLGFSARPWRKAQGPLPAMTAYTFTDLPSQCFWDSSRAQQGESAILTNFVGGKAGTKAHVAKSDLFGDLEAIHPGIAQLHDANEAIARWFDNPYARGSYACPKVGQYTDLVGCNKEPELGGRLVFAGEHVSEVYQGYMNGAVQSANMVAQAIVARVKT